MAFEIWLEQRGIGGRKPPEQLPIVIQVLRTPTNRLKALILLCKFVDSGPAAVNTALSIGIFPCIFKLLQDPNVELRTALIFLWARILAVYENCKEDLVKPIRSLNRTLEYSPIKYCMIALSSEPNLIAPNPSEDQAMCAFILATCCRDYRPAQIACLIGDVFDSCLIHVKDCDPLLRQSAILCIAQKWDDFDEARTFGVKSTVHELLCSILRTDSIPEVRAAVLYALGTLLGTTGSSSPLKKFGRSIVSGGSTLALLYSERVDVELGVAMAALNSSTDGSPLVRRELVVLLSAIVNEHRGQFLVAAYRALVERASRATSSLSTTFPSSASPNPKTVVGSTRSISTSKKQGDETHSTPDISFQTDLFSCVYKTLVDLTTDPVRDIATTAAKVVEYILQPLFGSTLGPAARRLLSRNLSTTSATIFDSFLPDGATIKSGGLTKNALPHSTPPSKLTPILSTSSKLSKGAAEGPPLLGSTPSNLGSISSTASKSGKPAAKSKPSSAAVEALISALVIEDEMRLKRKREAGTNVPDGGDDQVLPLKGSFYDLSLEYYKECQMRVRSLLCSLQGLLLTLCFAIGD